MFLDWGDGWKSVNDHAEDVAALAGFSIQWGTDDLAEQPEPSVMSFTLRDRTGWLTGRALTLAGARVLVQISEQPTWGMLRDDMDSWSAQHMRVEAMHQAYTPGLPSSTSSTAITLFDGLVQNGGDARPHGDGWLLELSASGRMILWKRLQKQGPTSSDARYAGLHWVAGMSGRVEELNRRAADADAPRVSVSGLTSTDSMAAYKTDDYPSQLDLLHRTFAHESMWPIWYEYPDRAVSRLDYMPFGVPVTLGVDTVGRFTVTDWTGETLDGLDAAEIIIDDE